MKKTALIFSLFSLTMFSCEKASNWNCSCSLDGGAYEDYIIQETKTDEANEKCDQREAVFQASVGVTTATCNLIDLGE